MMSNGDKKLTLSGSSSVGRAIAFQAISREFESRLPLKLPFLIKILQIMETLYFILGALSVITIVAVVSVFRINKKVALMVDDRIEDMERDLSDYISDVAGDLEQEVTDLHRRIDELDNLIVRVENELFNQIEREFEHSIAHTDSRVDKLADNVSKWIAEINQRLDSLDK